VPAPPRPAAAQVDLGYTAGTRMVQLSRRCCGFGATLMLVTEAAVITPRVYRSSGFRRCSFRTAGTRLSSAVAILSAMV
jgi:hypothetical protein